MKRISLISLLVLLCSLPGYAQFWINFGWSEPHCQSCQWMEQAMRLSSRQAADYHKVVHQYGQRIEKEARKHYRYWDQSAKKIFDMRMDRDRKMQRILSPSQFRLYVRFVRERPQRIHDYRDWYNNPHYPDYRPTDICHQYEDHYWHVQWDYVGGHWKDHYDRDHGRPGRPAPGHLHDRDDHHGDRSDWYSRPNPDRNDRNNRNNRNDRNDREKREKRENRESERRNNERKDQKDQDKKNNRSERTSNYRNS